MDLSQGATSRILLGIHVEFMRGEKIYIHRTYTGQAWWSHKVLRTFKYDTKIEKLFGSLAGIVVVRIEWSGYPLYVLQIQSWHRTVELLENFEIQKYESSGKIIEEFRSEPNRNCSISIELTTANCEMSS